jgi:hypothetical protein
MVKKVNAIFCIIEDSGDVAVFYFILKIKSGLKE